MADAGGGHFYFIADAAGSATTSRARSARRSRSSPATWPSRSAPDGVQFESLSPFPTQALRAAGRPCPSASRRGAAAPGRAAAQLPVRRDRPRDRRAVKLAEHDGVFETASVDLGWEYADNRVNDLQERDRDVDRAVARIFAARARQEAIGRNRAGDYRGAREALSGVARRIRDYAGRDAQLREIVAELDRETDLMAAPMAELTAEAGVLRQRERRPDAHVRRRGDEGAGRRRELIERRPPEPAGRSAGPSASRHRVHCDGSCAVA